MRKITFVLILLSLVFISSCSKNEVANVNAQEPVQDTIQEPAVATELQNPGCPRGITHDPAPGMCFSYVDQNNDGYCDYG